MRGNWAMLAMALLILLGAVLLLLLLQGQTGEMLLLCEKIDQNLDENPDAAIEAAKELERLWPAYHNSWQFFTMHSDLDEIERGLIELQAALSRREFEEAQRCCTLLRAAVEAVLEKENPSLRNVL
ncbi:MAG: DUF4363 family protein [Christensenellaceae bacterium]|jgi:hypothetical protein|nr:DUF4363 family protein [Christensenellaceae bacterium]